MAEISAAEVARLRKTTGAGMMDCKKALQEAEGDFEKAIEIIRKKGQAIANKRADREAGEGVVLAKVSVDGKYGAMIVLNCETDFVAKNEDFVALAYRILERAIEVRPENLDALKTTEFEGSTVSEKLTEQIGIIGEKLDISGFESIHAEFVQAYIHTGNKLATMAGFTKAGIDQQVYKDVAMQIAAMSPVAVDKDDVPEKTRLQELEIGREQARLEGKPEAILEKIAQGKLAKFYKESTLHNQEFIKNNKQTVKDYLVSNDKALSVTGFRRISLNK